jgi:tetratricopeptide (TPR) repeat protein
MIQNYDSSCVYEIYEIQGRIEDSLYAYQKELSSYSGNRSGVWFDLGFLYDKIGEPILSLEYYKRFVELESLTSNVALNMGLVLSSIGKDEEAIKLFDTAIEKDPKNLALLKNQSRFYKNLKQFDNAMKFIDKAMKIEPKNPWVLHQKALLLMEIGELSDSLQIFKSIQSMPELKDDAPSKELILNNIGWNHIKNNDNEKGLEYIEQALKINSTKPYILDSKAVALYNLGRYKESKKSYEEKFELTGNEKDRLSIIDCLIQLAKECERGSVDEKKYCEEALEIINLNLKTYASPDTLTFYYKGIVYLQLKKYEEAHKFQMIVIKNDPLDSYAWDELGDISNLNGNPSQALIYFKKSTELEPRFYNCKEYAKCLSIVKNYDDALFWIDQSIKFESTVEGYNYKGNIFYKMKKYSDALNCYEEALKIESNDGLVLQNKANLLRTIGKYEEAIKFFNMSIAVKSTFDNNIRKILTYIDWKKFEKALDLCNQALVKFPDDSVEILERMIGIFRNMKNQNMVKEYKEKLQKLKDLK